MTQAFQDGDIITNRHNGNICICHISKKNDEDVFYGMKARYVAKTRSIENNVGYLPICFQDYRMATQEEMQIFANAMHEQIEQDYWKHNSDLDYIR